MKRNLGGTLVILACVSLALPAFAMDGMEGGMGGDKGMAGAGGMGGMGGMQGMSGPMPMPKEADALHTGKKDGYTIVFSQMPMKMEGATNHLMVWVTGPDGKAIEGAKVGFDVVGPDKKDQKVMAMAMGNGYGGNLDLAAKGNYIVKTKFVGEGVNLLYEWTWGTK